MVKVTHHFIPHLLQTALNASLTEIGNTVEDVDADIKALQLTDQGRRTIFIMHDYLHRNIINICLRKLKGLFLFFDCF